MISGLRKLAYSISALAVLCFFLFPEPNIAMVGALLLQTLAYIVIAGSSSADGIVLTGITVILIGCLPDTHPLIRGPFFHDAKPVVLVVGVTVLLLGLLLVVRSLQHRH